MACWPAWSVTRSCRRRTPSPVRSSPGRNRSRDQQPERQRLDQSARRRTTPGRRNPAVRPETTGPPPAGDAPPFAPKPPVAVEQAQQPNAAAAFAAEHERQTRAAHDAEIAAAGESTNIGTDGEPHFLKMIPHEGVDASEGDHNPDDFDYVCGSDGQPWPCSQAQELERQEQERRGEQPTAAGQAKEP